MYKKILLFGGLSLGGIAVGTGVSLGIVLPKALKAKEGLAKFISKGGSYNSIAGKDKINIVALGDSETAGYNGIMGRDYLSYADFLAQSFKNAGKLGTYNNFALSGLRLSDFGKYVFEDANKVRLLKNADEILLTIGANDILSLVNLMGIPFGSALQMLHQNKSPGTSKFGSIKEDPNDKNKEKINIDLKTNTNLKMIRDSFAPNPMGVKVGEEVFVEREKIFNDSPELSFSKKDSFNMISETLKDFGKIMDGKGQYLINLDKDWYPKIFDLVKRSMATLARDLHKVAPHAQIQLLGHAFPFTQFPNSVKNNKKPELNNTSLKENFLRLLKSMEDGMKTSFASNDYVTFTSVDEIKEFHNAIKPLDFSDSDKFYESFINNSMPNITDIHPSTYGHELIGKYLFGKLAKESGIADSDITNFTMKSYGISTSDDSNTTKFNESQWTRKDEDKTTIKNFKKNTEFIHSISDPSSLGGSDNPVFGMLKPVLELIFKDMQIPSREKLSTGKFLYNYLNSHDGSASLLFGAVNSMIVKQVSNKTISSIITSSSSIIAANIANALNDSKSNKSQFIQIIDTLVSKKDEPTIKSSKYKTLHVILDVLSKLRNLVFHSKLGLKTLEENLKNDTSRIEQYAVSKFTLSSLINDIFEVQSSIYSVKDIMSEIM